MGKRVLPRTIFFYPFVLKTNRYVRLQLEILRSACDDVQPLTLKRLLLRNPLLRRRTIAILNFYEDRVGYHRTRPILTLLQNLAVLAFLRMACGKIIWVRHNLWPHDLPRDYPVQNILLRWMKLFSDVTITHRAIAGLPSLVAPHPLYFEGELPDVARDINYLYFGVIKRYKGLDELVEVWPRSYRLVIAGFAPDPELVTELKRRARARELDVQFMEGFLADDDLDALLLRTKYVILPHKDDTMIAAGTFYHAASLGCNVLASSSDFGRYLAKAFEFAHVFGEDAIGDVMSQVAYVDPQMVVAAMRVSNGSALCREAWRQIVGS